MHPDHSFTTSLSTDHAPHRDRRSFRTPEGRNRNILFLAAVVVGLAVIYWLANLGGSKGSSVGVNTARIPGARSVQVEVINAAGGSGLAQRVTDELRGRGFDVVDFGSDRSRVADRTVVIDRSGNTAAARDVAAALGLPKERVVQRLDRNLYLDVTVFLGKDAPSLGLMQSTSWKGTD